MVRADKGLGAKPSYGQVTGYWLWGWLHFFHVGQFSLDAFDDVRAMR